MEITMKHKVSRGQSYQFDYLGNQKFVDSFDVGTKLHYWIGEGAWVRCLLTKKGTLHPYAYVGKLTDDVKKNGDLLLQSTDIIDFIPDRAYVWENRAFGLDEDGNSIGELRHETDPTEFDIILPDVDVGTGV